MTDHVKNIKEALAAGPTSALFTNPRDDNKWKENEAFALACNPEAITALLGELEAKTWALQVVDRLLPLILASAEHGQHQSVAELARKLNKERAATKGATP